MFLLALQQFVDQCTTNITKELLQLIYIWIAEKQKTCEITKQDNDFFLAYLEYAINIRLDGVNVAVGLLVPYWQDEMCQESLKATFPVELINLLELATPLCATCSMTSYEDAEILNYLAEHIRQLICALAEDLRILLVVLAVRVTKFAIYREVITQEQLQVESKANIEIYASLADRFGFSNIKSKLEDMAFSVLYPKAYREISEYKQVFKEEHLSFLDEIKKEVTQLIDKAGITNFEVKARVKHSYSIYLKSVRYKMSYEKIHDILGMRCILEKEDDIYVVLGLLHNKYRFVEDYFKDYITYPKANGYRSLHTFLYASDGMGFEMQIRTNKMDIEAQYGAASHWSYKAVNNSSFSSLESPFWIQELTQSVALAKGSSEIFDIFKKEIFSEFVYAFTPRGKLTKLALGSTVLDFAFAIHTDIGEHTTGAMINGQYKSIRTVLQNGDQVEVLVSKQQKPTRSWLSTVKTSRAKSKIKAYLRAQNREQAIKEGQAIFQKIIANANMTLHMAETSKQMYQILDEMHCSDLKSFYQEIAYGRLTRKSIEKYFITNNSLFPLSKGFLNFKNTKKVDTDHGNKKPLSIKDISEIENMPIRFAKCCKPNKEDSIVGIIGQSRDIVIHTIVCLHISEPQTNKTMIPLTWNNQDSSFSLRVELSTHFLKSACAILKSFELKGVSLQKATLIKEKKVFKQELYLLITDSEEWHMLVGKLNKMKSVIEMSVYEDEELMESE